MSERLVLDGGREGSGVLEMNSGAFRKNLAVLGMEVSSESAYRFTKPRLCLTQGAGTNSLWAFILKFAGCSQKYFLSELSLII